MTPTAWVGAPWSPRAWQVKALERAQTAAGSPVIRAVTGAGKSILIAELAHLATGRVLVTTPTVQLVDQLAATLTARGLTVGKFYTHAKNIDAPVIVCCNPSLAELSKLISPPALWIADECHKTESDEIKSVLETWSPERRVGVTATPYRSDADERLSLFDSLAYNYGPAEAIRDGVVVPPRIVHYAGAAKDIDTACVELIASAVGPGVVDAISIADAENFATLLADAGVRAKSVHSKLHRSTVDKRIAMLESGELDCLVSVSMLVEGVDFPWLRWLCCRRPIGSRVRFAQYIGRGLRSFPDKIDCVVFDPHDLFGRLSLDYASVLGGDDDDDLEVAALEIDFELSALDGSDEKTLEGVPVRIIKPVVSFIRRLHLAMQCAGYITMIMPGDEWRLDDPTPTQLAKIGKTAWVINEPEVPPTQRRAILVAIKAAASLSRGTVADLISILGVLEYGWPDINEVI
jgi:superfamily II DNA or RNA helicase